MTIARMSPVLLFLAALACHGATALPAPVVRFRMESQTCGGPITFQFSIDQAVVGAQSLRNGETSAAYPTTPGPHATRAAFVRGTFVDDTAATLKAGQIFIQILSPYCS
jgi:hypothetical protein